MKKFILTFLVCVPFSLLNAESTPKKVYVSVHSEQNDSQFGVEDGNITIYDEKSSTYLKFMVKGGKISRRLVVKKSEDRPVVWESVSSYCPAHHMGSKNDFRKP